MIPPYLAPGDSVAIVAPAGAVDSKSIALAVKLLKSWQLNPVLSANIHKAYGRFAGSDADRRDALQEALDNKAVKAIWAAKGGYGTIRIIDQLDFSGFMAAPKWVIGFSDITVLHAKLHALGVASIHAQMPGTLKPSTPVATRSLKQALFGEPMRYELPCPLADFQVAAPLAGGNLSILYSLSGSAENISTAGKILFIEEVDEYLYHLDRMMIALKRSGQLRRLKALLVGGLTHLKDNPDPFPFTAQEIISHHADTGEYPVIFGVPSGHINNNCALYLGKELHLHCSGHTLTMSY